MFTLAKYPNVEDLAVEGIGRTVSYCHLHLGSHRALKRLLLKNVGSPHCDYLATLTGLQELAVVNCLPGTLDFSILNHLA